MGAPKPGSYVPPSIRNRGPGQSMDSGDAMQRRREENSVRVSNLSDDVREEDLGVSKGCGGMRAGAEGQVEWWGTVGPGGGACG